MNYNILKFAGLFLLCLCFVVNANAQQAVSLQGEGVFEEGNNILQPSELLQVDVAGNGNDATIQQIGENNQIDLTQVQKGDANINLAKLIQSGNYNIMVIKQNGEGNIANVAQFGELNTVDIDLVGDYNNLNILQEGDANTVIQDFINSDNVNVQFIQIGNNNEIIQELNGINAQDFKVTQQGNDMSIIIRRTSL